MTTQGSLRRVRGDGHCLFESWQGGRKEQLGLPRRSKFDWRQITARWMLRNAANVFNGMTLRLWVQAECQDGHVSEHAELETFEQYCNKMGSTARYGGVPEIYAFTKQDGLNAWVWKPIHDRPSWYERTLKVEDFPGAGRIHLCRNLVGDHYDLLVPNGAVFDDDDVRTAINSVHPAPPLPAPLPPPLPPWTSSCSCICTGLSSPPRANGPTTDCPPTHIPTALLCICEKPMQTRKWRGPDSLSCDMCLRSISPDSNHVMCANQDCGVHRFNLDLCTSCAANEAAAKVREELASTVAYNEREEKRLAEKAKRDAAKSSSAAHQGRARPVHQRLPPRGLHTARGGRRGLVEG